MRSLSALSLVRTVRIFSYFPSFLIFVGALIMLITCIDFVYSLSVSLSFSFSLLLTLLAHYSNCQQVAPRQRFSFRFFLLCFVLFSWLYFTVFFSTFSLVRSLSCALTLSLSHSLSLALFGLFFSTAHAKVCKPTDTNRRAGPTIFWPRQSCACARR